MRMTLTVFFFQMASPGKSILIAKEDRPNGEKRGPTLRTQIIPAPGSSSVVI